MTKVANPLQAKMLRLELLNVKADLERELGRLVLQTHSVRAARSRGCSSRRVAGPLGEPRARATWGAGGLASSAFPGIGMLRGSVVAELASRAFKLDDD